MQDINWIKQDIHNILGCAPSEKKINDSINSRIERCGGKLYKYCSLSENDCNHSIENLKNGTIYFSSPSRFNDPFDCYMGISFNEIAIEALSPILNVNGKINLSDYEALLTAWVSGEDLSKYNTNPISCLILNVLFDKDFRALAKKAKCCKDGLDVDILEFVASKFKYKEFVIRLFSALTNSNEEINLGIQMSQPERLAIYDSIFKNPEILSLFVSSDTEIKTNEVLIASLFGEEDIFSRLFKIGDLLGKPFAAEKQKIESFKSNVKKMVESLKEKIDKAFVISCFSETPDNILMWSHYANKHTGFCVEYDFSKVKNRDLLTLLYPVIYSEKRPTLPIDLLNVKSKSIGDTVSSADLESFVLALLTKSNVWNYENEWRLLETPVNLQNNCYVDEIVSKVYLGANISVENEERLRKIAKSRQIEVVKFSLDTTKFKLQIEGQT